MANQKLVDMMVAIRTALEDKACREQAQELLVFIEKEGFAHGDYGHPNGSLRWRVMKEIGKAKPRTIKEGQSCFSSHDDGPLRKAAKIMGVKLELYDIPPM